MLNPETGLMCLLHTHAITSSSYISQLVCSKGRRDSNENEQPKRLILNAHVDLLLNSENYEKGWPPSTSPKCTELLHTLGAGAASPRTNNKAAAGMHQPGSYSRDMFYVPFLWVQEHHKRGERKDKSSRIAVLRLQTGKGHQTPLGPASFQGFPTHKISWTIFF